MTKVCVKCGKEKSLDCFYARSDSVDGYRSGCKLCHNTRTREYNAVHGEEIAINKAEYYEKNRSRIVEYQNQYREENTGIAAARTRAWQKANPGLVNAHVAKREAAKIQRMPSWLTQDHLNEIKDLYKNCPAGYHVDHIVPLQGKNVSGLHVPWNLRIITAEENLRKGNKICQDSLSATSS